MENPRLTATYRLQMNAGFTLEDARRRLDYFEQLGVSHLYLSPILAARHGSMHGYDVVDPCRVNPELGTDADLRALSTDLHAREMGLIVDIVPNHMGTGAENPYWDDVLTHGERSRYARWFDIDWSPRDGHGRQVVLPVLGDELDAVIGRGEITLRIREGDTPRIVYFSHSFPIDFGSLPAELQLVQFDTEETGELATQYSAPEGRVRLRALLHAQHYCLVSWRRAATEINYRRFFDVNDLVALRMEDPVVFHETHGFVLELIRSGVIDGVRIDHIDGLLDPAAYLARLRSVTPRDMPLFVEKILSSHEQLRASWPVTGTTGYEFLNDVEEVFIDAAGFAELDDCYRRMRKLGHKTFGDVANAGKTAMLTGPLRADVARLVFLLAPIARATGHRWTTQELTDALVQFLSALPVYRTYIDANPVDPADAAVIEQAAAALPQTECVTFIRDLLLDRVPNADPGSRLTFAQRLQQLSGPATAKGVEDTALYVYVPLASRDEVGGTPARLLDDAIPRLHVANATRATRWPQALTTTNTHDTKRSADVRARLDVLSELPREWERSLKRWRRLNGKHRRTVDGRMAPDTNTEYLFYQMLVSLWPPPRSGRRIDDLPDRAWLDGACERLAAYLLKAAREARLRTSWVQPDPAYENALMSFVSAALEPSDDTPFLSDVARFVARIAQAGAWNALSRIAIHLTSPGTPDLYQGDELWNYALVDPDNRRQVDYDARVAVLADTADVARRLQDGTADWFDGRTKLFVTHRLLALRRSHPDLMTRGAYRPLDVRGERAGHVFAFLRSFGAHHAITIASRLVCTLVAKENAQWWGNTAVVLPDHVASALWQSHLLGDAVEVASGSMSLATTLAKLPVAVSIL